MVTYFLVKVSYCLNFHFIDLHSISHSWHLHFQLLCQCFHLSLCIVSPSDSVHLTDCTPSKRHSHASEHPLVLLWNSFQSRLLLIWAPQTPQTKLSQRREVESSRNSTKRAKAHPTSFFPSCHLAPQATFFLSPRGQLQSYLGHHTSQSKIMNTQYRQEYPVVEDNVSPHLLSRTPPPPTNNII